LIAKLSLDLQFHNTGIGSLIDVSDSYAVFLRAEAHRTQHDYDNCLPMEKSIRSQSRTGETFHLTRATAGLGEKIRNRANFLHVLQRQRRNSS